MFANIQHFVSQCKSPLMEGRTYVGAVFTSIFFAVMFRLPDGSGNIAGKGRPVMCKSGISVVVTRHHDTRINSPLTTRKFVSGGIYVCIFR